MAGEPKAVTEATRTCEVPGEVGLAAGKDLIMHEDTEFKGLGATEQMLESASASNSVVQRDFQKKLIKQTQAGGVS